MTIKERSILFSAPMVKAILSGRKTQTRRAIKPQPLRAKSPDAEGYSLQDFSDNQDTIFDHKHVLCPYGKPGDILYVKEAAWMWCEKRPNGITKTGRPKWHYVPMEAAPVHYCADHPDKPSVAVVSPETGNQWLWRKKIGRFLPRWAVRLRVVIKDVRVEKLQDISEADVLAEGIEKVFGGEEFYFKHENCRYGGHLDYRWAWECLWENVNGVNSYKENRWVWVISFAKVNP